MLRRDENCYTNIHYEFVLKVNDSDIDATKVTFDIHCQKESITQLIMAYSAESVMAKMSALNETQESIVTVAQWLMFYRQCAEQTATIWMEKLESSNYSKRLNLMYLANEIMQQAKGRNKPEFVKAFGERAANAMSLAYKGSPQEVQQKLRRVVDVWRQRRILDEQLQKDTEAKIDGECAR